ncbi:hypothetical protein VW23_008240 [Devosia insulae DS-56]|uniref:Uncharacterized protein n=1 Tax=Devosia insulae DS-56 TaxID=1116389 RepID=A0A1E5XWZ2_9HYPH|nr:hypothetical protein [Devosia insulae]OEO33099.1 hypothetical protein VW23_008240 [Devosia insulae DS-56]
MKYTIAAFCVAVVLIFGAVAQEAAGAVPVPVNADDPAGADSERDPAAVTAADIGTMQFPEARPVS